MLFYRALGYCLSSVHQKSFPSSKTPQHYWSFCFLKEGGRSTAFFELRLIPSWYCCLKTRSLAFNSLHIYTQLVETSLLPVKKAVRMSNQYGSEETGTVPNQWANKHFPPGGGSRPGRRTRCQNGTDKGVEAPQKGSLPGQGVLLNLSTD